MNLKALIIISILLIQYSMAGVDNAQLDADRKACYQIKTSRCFAGLIDKYSMASKGQRNLIRYDYACALMLEKNYAKAKENFKTVLLHESTNENLIKLTKQRMEQINEIYKKMAAANNVDGGDYYKKSSNEATWQKPYDIKVYIASSTGKEYLMKQALKIWSDKMSKKIVFNYVESESDANIVIRYVDKLSGTAAGVTKYPQIYTVGTVHYLHKVTVDISLTNPSGGKYTDTNLLGIILHEMGHALGITYHSESINDIMYYSTDSYKNTTISRRDINTVKRLYR